ncbi:MAG: riboflavin synthase [Fusobacteriaceae bacterium]|nr:riboflavin synthase, alpha subunit [Fusobacteriales bacterium]MDN5304795.1 riboflavin synthase [Fusobacteriaceae bacterium]
MYHMKYMEIIFALILKEVISIFTGLVEEKGKILSLVKSSTGYKIKILAKKILENVKIGDSIAVNGVCLTVTKFSSNEFEADIMNETVKRTNFKRLKINSEVNLEKSLTLNSYLGGHLVTGDVDCEGKIINIVRDGFAIKYEIEIDKKYLKYIVEKGRITIDGASLTVVDCTSRSFIVSLIPHTQDGITLSNKKIGEYVNIETDLIAKHIEKLIKIDENSIENLLKKF